MKNFVKGSLFALVVVPLAEIGIQVIQQLANWGNTAISVKMYELSKKLPQGQEEEKENTFAIGFQLPAQQEDEYEDEDDD